MAQVEIYTTVTVGGKNFFAETVHDEKELGPNIGSLRERKLVGPVTEKTKDQLAKVAKLAAKRVRDKPGRTDDDPDTDPDAGDGNDEAINEILEGIEEQISLKATWLFEAIDKLMKDGDEPVTTELVLLICEGVTTKGGLMDAVDAYLDSGNED